MNKLGTRHWGWATVCLVVLLSFLVIRPPGALGAHYPSSGEDSNCYACHSLDYSEGAPGTSYIASNVRSFPQIRANDGLPDSQSPPYLGCTFCHYQNVNAAMKPVLGHFQGWQSHHPVGYNFSTHTETLNEYVTGYGQGAAPTPNQLDCMDCHDIDIGKPAAATTGYPDHSNRPANNPYMLRYITGLGEYDGLCRTCHRSDTAVSVKGVSMQLTKHADGAPGRPLREDDGTILRTNDTNQDGAEDAVPDQCRACHDSHYSAKYKLFNDGKEVHRVGGADVADVAITGANCTEACHYPGDNNNLPGGNYAKYGHGKTESTYKYKNGKPDSTGTTFSMGLACTGCHVSLDIATKAHVEPTPSGANDREKYKNRFNLNINLQTDDVGSVYGNPIWGVCLQCHSSYVEHKGGGVTVGCQDCHDEHGEGSGTTSNVFMIPEVSKDDGFFLPFGTGTHQRSKAAAELVTYSSTRLNTAVSPYAPDVPNEDFYREDGADDKGVCDNMECHGAIGNLQTVMPGATHVANSGAVQTPGSDCEGCHQHNGDAGGGWRATDSCAECHSYPGKDTLNADHLLSAVHNRHVNATPGGYNFSCATCHYGYTHNESNYINGGTWNNGAIAPNVDIRFDPAINPGSPTYAGANASTATAPGVGGTGQCVGLYCHGNNPTSQADWTGSNETPVWTTPGVLDCGSCHAATPATPAANDAHGAHVTTAGYACADCHGTVPSTDAIATHVNNAVTLASGLTYSGGLVVGDGSYGTCSAGSCHNAAANIGWNVVQSDCSQCHQNAGDVNNFAGNDRAASMINSTEYTAADSGGHGKTTPRNIAKTCATASCHSMTAGHDFSAALTGDNPYRLVDQIPGGSAVPDFSCSYTTGCHPAATAAPRTGLTYGSIVTHSSQAMSASGGSPKRTWPAWRPRCTECHDPHGDGANLSMIQRELYDKGSYVKSDNTGTEDWGVHTTPDPDTIVFTDNTTGLDTAAPYTSYADNGPHTSLCQECHEGVAPQLIVAYKDKASDNVAPHTASGDCSTCHKHDSAFRPSGCNGCHGNTTAGNFWPDSTAEHGTAYPNRLGDHQQHVDAIAIARYGATPTMAQKNSTCDTCHPNPGGSGHDTNTGGSLANVADVHGDPQNTATSFKNIIGDPNGLATDTYDNTMAANGKDCSNVDCHYRVTTPTTGTPTANGDGWYSAAAVTCSSCHGSGLAGAALPNSHPVHVSAAGKSFGCWYCHPSGVNNASYTTSHETGVAEISFADTLDPATGGPRIELYAGLATTTRPVTYGVGPFATCTVTYCHGNFTNGKPANAPTWGTATTGDCGSCHDADGSIPAFPTVIASGNHTDHLTAASGPLFGATGCAGTTTGCHTAATVTTATHVDGSVEFDNIAVSPAASTLGATAILVPTATDTDRCSYCHGTATVNTQVGAALAKTNWANGAYVLPCLTCHAGTGGATQYADGTGLAAPNELGDDVNFGAEVKGHNRPTAAGGYTDLDSVVTNVAANKACTDCHDAAAAHINGVNDTTYAGQRLLATINTVATGSTVTGACYACHGTSSGTPASSQVSTHGNTNAAFVAPAKDGNGEAFAYKCEACHNPHGMTNGTGYSNIFMIKTAIGVGNSFTTSPGGADATTIANIRFERVSGVNSLDDDAAGLDNVCYTCHVNASRPGSGTALRTSGGNHTGNAGGYTSNDTGKNCASCHVHNYDAVQVATTDGFMPQQCNACHSYPGLSTVGAEKVLSGVHNMHVNTTTGYGYACTVCHYNYNHNQSNFVDGGVWNDTNVPVGNINVRFDPTINAGTDLTYAGGDADVGTGASGTHNGVCANLYCHGDNTTSQTDWTGTGSPAWGTADPARLLCTGCHADAPTTGAHQLHANNTGSADRSDCNLCHTNVGLIDAVSPIVATHANGTTDVLLTWTGATGPLYVNGYCSANTCHGSSTADGFWNDTVLNCTACHYYSATPLATGVGGNDGAQTFRVISEASHDGHFAAAGRTWSCNDCHPDNTTDTAGAGSNAIGLAHLTVGTGTDAVILTNKAVPVQDNALISTTQVAQWWNGATDWVDAANTCANKCHNPSAGAYLSTAWGTTNASCTFCHAAASPGPATGSHAAHMNAATLFGINTIGCTSCHADNTGNYGHMSGAVNLANMTGLSYSGTVAIPYGAPFGACTTTSCHTNGKGVAVASPTWGVSSADCTICHGAPPSAGNDGARHTKHDANTAYVGNACGNCHAANNNKTSMGGYTTHINGAVNMGGTSTVAYLGGGDCTNACHDVNPATSGDWLDTGTTLACLECHSGTYIGGGVNAPASGLHAIVPTVSGIAHDASWDTDGGDGTSTGDCMTCHTATPSTPSSAHVNGVLSGATANFAATVGYLTGTPPTCGPNGAMASCHGDSLSNGDAGTWRRRWDTSAANSDGTECANCHGTFSTGWRWNDLDASTTGHTDPYGGNTGDKMDQHAVCQSCHGWGYAGYSMTWDGTPPAHGDGSITMNGPDATHGTAAGAQYNDTTGGCAAACHLPTFVMKTNSGWAANYGDFGSGACETCHNGVTPGRNGLGAWAPNVMGDGTSPTGTGTTPKPYDNGTYGFNVSGHGANGTASTKFDLNPGTGVNWMNPNAACTDCHQLQGHHFDGTLDSATTGSRKVNTYHLRTDDGGVGAPFVNESAANDYTTQFTLDQACYNRCHAAISQFPDMRHVGSAEIPYGVAMFGGGTSGAKVGKVQTNLWPYDRDLSTRAFNGAPDYMPCVTCHNVHGANITEPGAPSPRMMRLPWLGANSTPFCETCHY